MATINPPTLSVRHLPGVARPVDAVRRAVFLVAGIVACGFAPAADAAEFIVIEDECRGHQLLVSGVIEAGDAGRFERHLAALVNDPELPSVQDPETLWTIKLDSPGGDITEAMRMGRLVRAAVATTETSYRYARRPDGVWDFEPADATICLQGPDSAAECFADVAKAECAGACLLVWLAGAERFAHEGRLGLHGLPAAGPVAQAVADYLVGLGVSAEQLSTLPLRSEAPPNSEALLHSGARWLDWPARHALAGRSALLEAELAGCPPRLSATESLDSVMHADPSVRDRLMDRAEAHRACRRAAVAALRGDLATRLAAEPAALAGHAYAP